jgi:UDP-3-O-[3-hydroxymyristoyl] N-acetylglucosamine deacetylase
VEQQTLAQAFTLEGVGIHTGAAGRVTAHPAPADTGRVFRSGGRDIPARADHVADTSRCTTLGADGARVSTVEHLLSALHGLGVDNVIIEVVGPEIPILDGSALPWVEAIQAAGVAAQGVPARVFTLAEPCEVAEGASRFQAAPGDGLRVEVVTEFHEWPEGRASQAYASGPEGARRYVDQVAPARTFAFRREVEMLLAAGLAKGGSLDNALIISPPDTFSTPLRLPQEWCAHKLLDVIGDLALVDARLNVHLTAIRPGHRLNVRLAGALLEQHKGRENKEI